jgi:hypothetical protein
MSVGAGWRALPVIRLSTLVVCLLCGACTQAGLYDAKNPPIEANRVAVRGQVCTEDPELAKFPVRLVIVADQANGSLYANYDPAGERLVALGNLVNAALQRPEYSVAIVGYGPRARKLAPEAGAFGRNPGELLNAINRLSIPEPCNEGGYCRDYNEALRVAGNIIKDDLANISAGERGLTQYVVLLMNAGLPVPLVDARECCARGDASCRNEESTPSQECQSLKDTLRVSEIRDAVIEAGASGFELHAMHLAADEEGTINDAVARSHERMAFVGGGRYVRAENASGLNFDDLRLFDRQNALRVKHFILTNRHAVVNEGQMVPDSDGDGLHDGAERMSGTDPTVADSDGDSVGDLVESLISTNPLMADIYDGCVDLERPEYDSDRDGLTDCEERLIGTDASMVDTDGDGLPDGMELVFGTDYLNRDDVVDDDGDGVSNGDEVREHTDPRVTDLPARLGSAYRYTVEDLGILTEASIEGPKQLTGIKVLHVGGGSTPGVGTFQYTSPTDQGPATLAWWDALDDEPGEPVQLGSSEGPYYIIPSSSYAAIQGDQGRFVRVEINAGQLPPRDMVERVRVVFRDRHCIDYVVRNVRLLPTLLDRNDLILYFAEAPASKPEAAGPFRVANIPIRYVPPATREPTGAMLQVLDEEFVHYPRRDLD